MGQIEIKVTFEHTWFPQGKFVSFWAFFDKINTVQDETSETANTKKFFSRLTLP